MTIITKKRLARRAFLRGVGGVAVGLPLLDSMIPALAAADDGVEVQVVADACAGIDDESHAKALDIMRLYSPLVEVVGLAEAIGQAAGSGAAPAS